MASKKKFDLENLHTQLHAVYETSSKLDMDAYIRAYTEFNNFFELLGTVFGFVATDVTSKIEILQAFRNGVNGSKFQTIEQMIEFEKSGNKFEDSNLQEFTLTQVLKVFIAQFLEELNKLDMHEKLATTCQNVYNATLSQYHAWIIRKAAIVAMYGLPSKHGLLERIKGPNETEEHYVTLLPKAVEAMKEVYNRTQRLYELNNILDLP